MELDFSNDVVEKLLFKKTLTDKKYLSIMSNVFDKRWFQTENLSILYKLVLNYYDKYNATPNIKLLLAMVKRYIEKHPTEDIDFQNVSALVNEVQNIDLQSMPDDVISSNLKEFIRKRALRWAIADNIEKIESNSDQVIDDCLARFDKVQRITFNDTDLGLDYFDPQMQADHWDYIMNPKAKIPTGWPTLDQYTNGGFLKDGKMLAIFMGQAGLGKSVFLSNIAVNFLKQNLSVVVISLEMSQDVYATRFDAHISKKNINKLSECADEALQRIKDFYAEHSNSNLYIKEYPPRSIKTSDIEMYLENLKNNGKHFDVVVVDYLNLVLPQHSSDNMYQGALEVSEKLRALSYKFNVPVVSAVQANSEGMNNENIGMEHISESRGIAHTADFILALYQMPEDRENGIINGRILKNRLGGQVGKLMSMKLDAETLTLADITFDSDFSQAANDDVELGNIVRNLPNINASLNGEDIDAL